MQAIQHGAETFCEGRRIYSLTAHAAHPKVSLRNPVREGPGALENRSQASPGTCPDAKNATSVQNGTHDAKLGPLLSYFGLN